MLRVIKSKLSPPPTGTHLISRPRVENLLRGTDQVPLALVHAPAGFGKTTLMTQWCAHLQQQGIATGWYTLDEADNDIKRFLTYAATGLEHIPSIDLDKLLGRDSLQAKSLSGLLLNLLDCVASVEIPFALFLDDFETVDNPEILDAVRQLLQVIPVNGLMVVGSRNIPDFGLGRLRAKGLLVEIGEKDLSFTQGETEHYLLQERGLELETGDVEQLQRCTEGWAAGLQLAALACDGAEDLNAYVDSFSGNFAEIADYLAEDVFSRQPVEVRDFLLNTSILERLTAPLCDVVTGRTDSHEMLDYLEKANLFISPLDNERCWYRYHKLFAEFLRSRLERGFRAKLVDLHSAASDWFLAHDQPLDAAEHALAVGDTARAATILATSGYELFVRTGQMSTVIHWVERLPWEVVAKEPKLLVAYCFALTTQNRHADVEKGIKRLLHDVERLPPVYMDEVNAARALSVMFQDRVDEAHQIAEEALAVIAQPGTMAEEILSSVLGWTLVTTNRFDELTLSLLSNARKNAVQMNNVRGAVYAACWEGQLEMTQGRLEAADERYRWALARAREAVRGYSSSASIAAAFLSETLYERDKLSEVEQLLSKHLPLLCQSGSPDVLLVGYITLARTLSLRGENSRAQRLLDEVERIGRDRGLNRIGITVNLERSCLYLQSGDLEDAEKVAHLWLDPILWKGVKGHCMPANDPNTPEIARIRLLIHQGQEIEALELLKAKLAKARASHRFRQVLKLECLMAVALEATGKHRAALRALGEALKAGSDEGFIRTFADEGRRLSPLIHELRAATDTGEEMIEAGVSIDYLNQILKAMGEFGQRPLNPSPEIQSEESAGPVEAPTEREIKILELLGQGLSNQAMADRLCVSESTVRYHLRNLNAKLGAKSRTQALFLARQLNLIP
jgi:LuxR family maltose regulon positive regulatory protein